jgi:3-keto-disaccharide hydrolase
MRAVGIVLIAAALAGADDFKLEEGFTRLDNGKDLKGWTGKLEGWSVKDGAIHLDAKKAKGHIYSEKTHSRDCVIRLQFRATPNADSGLYVHGKQLQVRDYPKAGPPAYARPAKPAGQWNDLELDVTGGVAVVKLNGQVIEKAWKIGDKPKQGVGLQRERGDFDFRYVRVKEKK